MAESRTQTTRDETQMPRDTNAPPEHIPTPSQAEMDAIVTGQMSIDDKTSHETPYPAAPAPGQARAPSAPPPETKRS